MGDLAHTNSGCGGSHSFHIPPLSSRKAVRIRAMSAGTRRDELAWGDRSWIRG